MVKESKNVTLRVDTKLYDKYKRMCQKKGLVVSRQVEIMMEEGLRNE